MWHKGLVGCCLVQSDAPSLQSISVVVASCARLKKYDRCCHCCNQQHIKVWLLHPCILWWLTNFCRMPLAIWPLLKTSKICHRLKYNIKGMLNFVASCNEQHIKIWLLLGRPFIIIPSCSSSHLAMFKLFALLFALSWYNVNKFLSLLALPHDAT